MATTRRPVKPKPARKRAAVYLRISKDPFGDSDAPERQLKDCKAHAKIHDLEIAAVYEDRDRSAYREGVVREGFEEMLLGLADGEYDAILCWKLDRLVRRTVEFARVWEICTANNAAIISVRDSFDTSTDVGLMVASILVAFAQMESATTSTRSRAKERSMAEAGRHKGRGRRAFGYEVGWTAIIEEEAALIREAADRILAGERPRSIAIDWNRRGLTTMTGRPWQPFALHSLMRQARLWGWREHKGELMAKGDWPPILDEERGRALRTTLERKSPPGELNRRTYMLSGILRCGRCGKGMKSQQSGKAYGCPPQIDGGCNGTSVTQGSEWLPADQRDALGDSFRWGATAAVEEMVLARLDSTQMRKAMTSRQRRRKGDNDAELLAQIGMLDQRLAELAIVFTAGDMSATAYGAATRELEGKSDELANRLATLHQAEPFAKLLGEKGGIRSVWTQLDSERKRVIIQSVVDRVIVHPVGRGHGHHFRPERLEPIWRV